RNSATLVQLIDFSKYGSAEIYDQATGLTYGMAVNNALVAVIGLLIIGVLLLLKVRGAILIGILATAAVSIPLGVTSLTRFKLDFTLPSLAPTFFTMDFAGLLQLNNGNFWSVLFTAATVIIAFSLVDMFDTIGTLLGTARKAGMLDQDGQLPRMKQALMADAVATSVGACLGTSTVTTYVESAAGIAEGGRTGLTAVVTGVLFILALFCAPLLGVVPGAATAPALIVVGVMMMGAIKYVEFDDLSEGIPAFLTIVLMPFSYSIATGIAAGLIAYPVLKIFKGQAREVHPVVYILALLFVLRFAVVPH
ncbi:NCS2 family permease, partial [Mycobacterium tuberculosis]|uniref:NCS2 family permease n=1 Tax=Mycobacterium tuberculosis TaxID=1773 RepID=UPI0012665A97